MVKKKIKAKKTVSKKKKTKSKTKKFGLLKGNEFLIPRYIPQPESWIQRILKWFK